MAERNNCVCGIEAAKPHRTALSENIVSQVFGLVALLFVIHAVNTHNYRIMVYAVCLFSMLFVIPKPNLIPYLLVLSFFTLRAIVQIGMMLSVKTTDAVFLFLIFAFILNNKIDFNAVLKKQRFLMISVTALALWTVVGFIVNFYGHTWLVNVTSLFFILNFFMMAAMVVLFSQPQWNRYRNKIILFYVICSFSEIVIAILMKILEGARAFSDFHKLTGTLGSHHGMFGNVMILSFGVAACAFFELRGKYEKRFSLCIAVLSIVVMALSGSRSAILGILLAIPVIVLLSINYRWSILAVIVLSVAAIAGASSIKDFVITTLAGSADAYNEGFSSYGRLLIWERVYEHALYGPWVQKIFGIGAGTFNTLRFNYFLENGTFASGAHNNILHAFVETGIVGMVLFAAVFAEIIRKLTLRSRRYNDNAARCFLFCTLILLFSGLTQETFWFNSSFGRFWLQYMFFYLLIFNFRTEEYPVDEKITGRTPAYVNGHLSGINK